MGVEAVVTDLGEEVEVTLLSGVVMHLADSQGVASVRDSGGCEAFPPVDFLVAEMMAVFGRADAVVISHFTMVASITAFLHTIVSFDAPTDSSPISRSSGLASLTGTQTTMTRIPTTTQTMTANRVTMTNIWTSRPCRPHRNSPDVPTRSFGRDGVRTGGPAGPKILRGPCRNLGRSQSSLTSR